ncbi:MAG TPA: Rne/Rng family ribonuclease [Stellaceae bacterium]|jgi:ribonuclease E|nr:Rne/Rng family ribonuclease [Stellaceae bacterium]
MAKRMLIDATHPEETRVVVLNGNRLEEFDFETSTKKQIKGNIYLAKVTRVEPSLQAAFVEYGGNRHGFLAFSEIHPDYYQIPVSDREALMAAAAHELDDLPAHAASGDAGALIAPDAVEHDAAEHDRAGTPAEATSVEATPAEDSPAIEALAASEGLAAEVAYETASPAEVQAALEPHEAGHYDSHYETGAHDESRDEHGHEPNGTDHATGSHGDDFVGTMEDSTVEVVGGDDIEEAQQRSRVHYRNYKIQEVIKRRQILLVQVTKEERGNKGAALTTYLSLAGRYCVLMPNAGRGGGVSRKITSLADRRRLKELMEELNVPEGMGVIVRTAGSERPKAEIHRDYEYLLRLWDDIRDLTLRSSAPAFIYEEGNLIKRAIRDLYNRDIEEIQVEGEDGYRTAKEFMRMLMPGHVSRVRPYRDPVVPLLHRYQVDAQIDQIHNPTVQLKSGGYIVINPTEALVAIDVNSGRSTKERNIEETATKTNLEAAEEVARQLRLRDLAGLIVIDFIDMEESRNRGAVERRLKEAMKNDRARIQLGRISPFGLLEMSRQRLRSSLIEASTQVCPHCNGTGTIRSTESTALVVLRALEEEGIRQRTAEISLYVPTGIALYILNQKRDTLMRIEQRYGFRVLIQQDDSLVPPAFRLERVRPFTPAELALLSERPQAAPVYEEEEEAPFVDETVDLGEDEDDGEGHAEHAAGESSDEKRGRRRRRRRRRGGNGVGQQAHGHDDEHESAEHDSAEAAEGGIGDGGIGEDAEVDEAPGTEVGAQDEGEPRRRRGRRGGRRRGRERGERGERGEHSQESRAPQDGDDFEGYPAALDFARDGREHLFDSSGEDGSAVPAAVEASSSPVAAATETPASADAMTGEATPAEPAQAEGAVAEAPKRRRVRRKKPTDELAETPAAETSAAKTTEAEAPKPVAEEAPAPKPRSRRKKAVATEAPVPEAVAVETVAAEAAAAEAAAAEAVAARTVAQPETPAETVIPMAEVSVAEAPESATGEATAKPEAEPRLEPGSVAVPAPEPVAAHADAAPATVEPAPGPEVEPKSEGPRRTGWWRRLVQ